MVEIKNKLKTLEFVLSARFYFYRKGGKNNGNEKE